MATKILVSIPHQLDAEQRVALIRDYGERITAGRASWLAAIHMPSGDDERNWHAHFIVRDKDYETGRVVVGLSSKNSVDLIRSTWESVCNEHLEAAGIDARVDRRSNAERGVERFREITEGPAVTALERRHAAEGGVGPATEVRATNLRRRAQNAWLAIPDAVRDEAWSAHATWLSNKSENVDVREYSDKTIITTSVASREAAAEERSAASRNNRQERSAGTSDAHGRGLGRPSVTGSDGSPAGVGQEPRQVGAGHPDHLRAPTDRDGAEARGDRRLPSAALDRFLTPEARPARLAAAARARVAQASRVARAAQEARERAAAAEVRRQAEIAAQEAAKPAWADIEMPDLDEDERPSFRSPNDIPRQDRPLYGLLAYHRTKHAGRPEYEDRASSIIELLGDRARAFDAWLALRIGEAAAPGPIAAVATDALRRLVAWADPLRYDAWLKRDGFDRSKVDAEVRRIGGPKANLRPVGRAGSPVPKVRPDQTRSD